jgi:hypothetical protein
VLQLQFVMFSDCVVYVFVMLFWLFNGWLEHLFWPDIFYIHWCVNMFLALYLDLFKYIKYENYENCNRNIPVHIQQKV